LGAAARGRRLLVTRGGVAKIADFGIARIGAGDSADAIAPTDPALSPTEHSGLTGTGALLGTPLFMAPELGRGAKSADASCDIWSFGVVAYELLTKKFPFATPPVLDALGGRSIHAPSFPVEGVGVAIAALLTLCLELDPSARPTAAELAIALAQA
jgi:serine/threonine protein kinase